MEWQETLVSVLRVCGGDSWVKEESRSIWHKVHSNIRGRTNCGTRILNANNIPYTRNDKTDPVKAQQCVVCQFDLPHVHLMEFKPPAPQEIPPGYIPTTA